MKEKKEIISLIQKLFTKRINKSEMDELNQWYDSENKDEEVIIYTEKKETKEEVKTRLLLNILNKLNRKKNGMRSEKRTFTIWRVAASIGFILLISAAVLYHLKFFQNDSIRIQWNEQVTRMGQKSIVLLPEGSKITLKAGSKFKFPNRFEGSNREVYLDGEAYFEIAKMDEKPFVVHTENVVTTVLGTKFNIKAFPDENDITVSLVEGKVKVTDGIQKEKYLEPKQQFSFNKISNEEEISDFNVFQVTGWKDNILVFSNTPLKTVFIELERAYGVKFELSEKSFEGFKVTGNFQNESYPVIAEALKRLTKLKYRMLKENNIVKKIIFYKK